MLMHRMRTRKHTFALTALANGLAALAAMANGFEMDHAHHSIASHLLAPPCRERREEPDAVREDRVNAS